MALSNINVGTSANDGTGDTIRAAFQKVNSNNALFSAVALSGAYSDLSGTPAKSNATGSDPTVNSDSGAGYAASSLWFNTSTGYLWRCYSAASGVAVWNRQDYADHPGYVAGNWYVPYPGTQATGSALVANTCRAIPFIPKANCTLNQLGGRMSTGASLGNCQFAIYNSDPSTKLPTTQASANSFTPSISTTSAGGAVSAFTSSATPALQAGTLYWLIVNVDSTAGGTVIFYQSGGYAPWIAGASTQSWVVGGGSTMTSLTASVTFNTWGDLTSAGWTPALDTKYALIGVKIASIP